MEICSHMVSVFGEIAGINIWEMSYSMLRSPEGEPYGARVMTGYVHTLTHGNAILITNNFVPYLITADLVQKYDLHTGDYLQCYVAYLMTYQRTGVTKIEEVKRVHYDDGPFTRSARSFPFREHKINLGTTNGLALTLPCDTYQTITEIYAQAPFGTKKIILALDTRAERYPDDCELFLATADLEARDKLTVCLSAFFRAKELATEKADVILVIDSLDKMFTVFNNCMQETGQINPEFISTGAMTDLENLLCTTSCLQDGGTFTVVGLQRPTNSSRLEYVAMRFQQLFDQFI